MAAENGAANGGDKPEPKKESSHSDHRDEFVASEGLSSAGEAGGGAAQPNVRGGGGVLLAGGGRLGARPALQAPPGCAW